jgi:alpha-amylase
LLFFRNQPFSLKRYRFFDLGHDNYIMMILPMNQLWGKVAANCYLRHKIILDQIGKHKGNSRLLFHDGNCNKQFRLYAPEVWNHSGNLLKQEWWNFVSENCFSFPFLSESRIQFEQQVGNAREWWRISWCWNTFFQEYELIYSDQIGSWVADMGSSRCAWRGKQSLVESLISSTAIQLIRA